MTRRTALTLLVILGGLGLLVTRGLAYERCGYLTGFASCYEFWPLGSPGDRAVVRGLPSGEYSPGVLYRILGDSVACDSTCNPSRQTWCLTPERIDVCPGESLGCGVVQPYDANCGAQIWRSPMHGDILLGGPVLSAGDTVDVVGIIDRWVFVSCYGDGALVNEVATPCTRPLATQSATWGGIKAFFR